MFSRVISAAVYGIDAYIVNVETDVGFGLPTFDMSGALGSKVREAKDRVRVAIKNSGIINTFHRKSEKILDERNKMQYNRGRCNFCNTMFDDESRPICGLFGLKNRKEGLYEIK